MGVSGGLSIINILAKDLWQYSTYNFFVSYFPLESARLVTSGCSAPSTISKRKTMETSACVFVCLVFAVKTIPSTMELFSEGWRWAKANRIRRQKFMWFERLNAFSCTAADCCPEFASNFIIKWGAGAAQHINMIQNAWSLEISLSTVDSSFRVAMMEWANIRWDLLRFELWKFP